MARVTGGMEEPEPAVVCVTAFRDIGRGGWDAVHGEWRRTTDEYVGWFLNLASSPLRLVCFCDEPVASRVRERAAAANLPVPDVRPYDAEDTLYRLVDGERRVMASPALASRLGATRRRHPEHSVPEYNAVQHAKVSFVRRAASDPAFAPATHFAWIDFGYFRAPSTVPAPAAVRATWRAVATPDRVVYASFRALAPDDVPDPLTLARTAPSLLQGSMFVLPRALAAWYEDEYARAVLAMHAVDVADDDQAVALQVFKRHPERFAFAVRPEWFAMFCA